MLGLSGCTVAASIIFFVLSPTPGYIFGVDDQYYFLYLPSLVVDEDLDFSNQWETFRRIRHEAPSGQGSAAASGRVMNKYGIGYAVLALPFFLLGFPVTWLARAYGLPWTYDGMNPGFQFSTTLASLVWGGVGLVLCQHTLRRHFPKVAAQRATLLVFLATPLLYYLSRAATMAHATAFFTVALWLCLWDARSADLPIRQAIALGVAAALAFMVRYPNLLLWLGVVVDFPRWRAQRPAGLTLGHWLRFWFLAGVAFGICILPQLWVWHVQYGAILVNPYPPTERFTHWIQPQLWKLLFSDYRGLFNWHPILLLAVGGLVVALRSHRWLAVHSLVILIGLIYLNASWYGVSFGVSFGSRVFVDVLALFAVGLAAFLVPGRWQAIRWGVCLVLALLNIGLVLAYRSPPIPFFAPVSWPQRIAAIAEVSLRIVTRLHYTLTGPETSS